MNFQVHGFSLQNSPLKFVHFFPHPNIDSCSVLIAFCFQDLPFMTDPKYQHYLITYKMWHSLYLFGVVGTFLNLLLLHAFYEERDILASSVNTLIYMDCFHRMIYSAVMVPWRNYNMITGKPLFSSIFGFNEVNSSNNAVK